MRGLNLCPKTLPWKGFVKIPLGVTLNRNASTSTRNQIETAVKSVSNTFPTVDLTWKDGHVSRFHPIWLVDHDPKFVHETSSQRNLDSAELPQAVAHPCEIDVTDQGGKITFKWDSLTFSTGKSSIGILITSRACTTFMEYEKYEQGHHPKVQQQKHSRE
mmetsp:Transcript_1137/g.1682  ORF Transcript_1137/g.1682 Transcript_1137/m.1682 type:complete len:160 (+) Transcript_1137:95-574(+)